MYYDIPTYIMLKGLIIYIYILLCKISIFVEQNPVIPNTELRCYCYITHYMSEYIVFITLYILYTYFKNILKCNVYYRPDMG